MHFEKGVNERNYVIQAFIHVSTAYANCNRHQIDEKFYKVALTGENSLKLAECLDEKTLDAITPEIIKDWPNTYTFTKCLAEDLVRTQSKGLPVAVFRPAIGKISKLRLLKHFKFIQIFDFSYSYI